MHGWFMLVRYQIPDLLSDGLLSSCDVDGLILTFPDSVRQLHSVGRIFVRSSPTR
jgi:hypothetical protein